MQNYVITILDNEKSIAAADRCIQSGKSVGLPIKKWKATTPRDNLDQILSEKRLPKEGFEEQYSRQPNAVAAFLSHFSLWEHCLATQTNVTIFEHDAFLVDKIPDIPFNGCISFGHPSYGKWINPKQLGVNELTSKQYFPGAHAYRVSPQGAEILISTARERARPTDIFLNIITFPFLQEYYPWPVIANDSFTTIQNSTGCIAKHNKVEIIDA